MPTKPGFAPLILLLALSACDGPEPGGPSPARLPESLVVVDRAGRPIAGVLVDPDSMEARAVTDDRGRCGVTEGMALAESVTLWRYGYESVEAPIATLEKAEPLVMRMLEVRGHITVSIRDEEGGAVVGAVVG